MSGPGKTRILYVFLFLLILGSGQAAADSRIGIGLGGAFTGFRDETEAPINRYLNALTYEITGNFIRGYFLHSFGICFYTGNAKMAAPFIGFTHKQYNSYRFFMSYSLGRRLWGSETFPGYLGGAFRSGLYFTLPHDDLARFPTGFVLFSLDLHLTQKWNINARNLISFSAGFPVFGYAIRPPFAMTNNEWEKYLSQERYFRLITLGEFTSLHNFLAFYCDFTYHFRINTWLSLYSRLGFELSRFTFYRQRIDAITRLTAGVSFTF